MSFSNGLYSREAKSRKSEEENAAWREKYGSEAQKMTRQLVEENMSDYEYLKSFAI